MDLNDRSNWTRERLEEEAQKLGVENPQTLPRSELVLRVIASSGLQGLRRASRIPAVRKAQEILQTAYLAAHAAAPRQMETLRSLAERLPEVARKLSTLPPPVLSPSADRERDFPQSPFDSAYYSSQVKEPATTRPPLSERPTEPVPGEGPSTRRFVEAPVRTVGVARVLAEQGHRELALGVYGELTAAAPGDQALRAEADKVRRGEIISERHTAVGMVSPEAFEYGRPDEQDTVRYEIGRDGGLGLSWQVSPQGVRRASAVLGQLGELAVRVIRVVPDQESLVRSEVWERGPVAKRGDCAAEPLPARGRCFASIGMRARGRFVSIAHAEIRS